MVEYKHLRDMTFEPLTEYADAARKMATELESFSTETQRQKVALASAWQGEDATAADTAIGRHATEYQDTSGQYGRVDAIVTNLVEQLRWAKQSLDTAIGAVPNVPARINDAGRVRVNYAALGSNPAPAAVRAAESRARQVQEYVNQAVQHATESDEKAKTQLAEVRPEPVTVPRGARTPVGDLNMAQMANAEAIIKVGESMGISERGQAIALATAMQESTLRNLANTTMPDSLTVPNEGTGKDHDSVGLFQQRPSQGWGTIRECMDPDHASTAFYNELKRVKNWENLDLTVAAQKVQRSAYPDAYAKWEDLAYQVLRSPRAQ
ncbi:hypothetical protein AB0I28_19125 [Phytomonospora sp. NPDC050363]|uniref:hypothetical protein n=1 Tax=Phytomonospora sp. NPDC050363 TaxID=3155642 RepID=UPI0033FCC76B